MTQAQPAQWLGNLIKQVKYLEHQRRNPSGPDPGGCSAFWRNNLVLRAVSAVQAQSASLTQPKVVVRAFQAGESTTRTATLVTSTESTVEPKDWSLSFPIIAASGSSFR